jgi:type IV pilus assembly protein PilO
MGGIQMRISKREKILLGLLLFAVFIYLFYNFVHLRNEEKIAELETELELKNSQVETLMASINNEEDLNSQFKELNFEISDMSKSYLPDLDQEKLILFIDEKLSEYEIETTNISFNNESIINFTKKVQEDNSQYRYRLEELRDIYYDVQKVENPEEESTEEDETLKEASAENFKFNINFSADYYNLLDFINDLQNNQFEVTLSNMTLTLVEDAAIENIDNIENLMSGTMMMDIYSIPKLHEHDYMNWVWTDYIDSGRSNPFYESDVQRDQYWTTRYDFVMNVKPISSDLPTVTLGEEDDIARDSYVYADSNSVESIDIEVMQDGEMYYYRYRTSMQTYPSNYEEEWIEFVPENEYISMQINSEPRSGTDDESGVELNIVNDTDIIFYINILNEDLINPRVEYTESGNVVFRVNE